MQQTETRIEMVIKGALLHYLATLKNARRCFTSIEFQTNDLVFEDNLKVLKLFSAAWRYVWRRRKWIET